VSAEATSANAEKPDAETSSAPPPTAPRFKNVPLLNPVATIRHAPPIRMPVQCLTSDRQFIRGGTVDYRGTHVTCLSKLFASSSLPT